MNDTVATEDQKQPVVRHELEARKSDRDFGRRTSSGPADICAAPPGRTYDRSRPNRSARKKVLAMRPSTYDSMTFSLNPIGFDRSSLKSRAEAPKFGTEGAPDAWLEVNPLVAEGLEGVAVGAEIILLTWFHQSRRD